MWLVNYEDGIYEMTQVRLWAYLEEVARGRDPRIAAYGSYRGGALNVTNMGACQAAETLARLKESMREQLR